MGIIDQWNSVLETPYGDYTALRTRSHGYRHGMSSLSLSQYNVQQRMEFLIQKVIELGGNNEETTNWL